MPKTIYGVLSSVSKNSGDKPALLGVSRESLSYGNLIAQIERTAGRLNQFGLGRGSRIGIAMANGPDAASCCLSVASAAAAAPLHPASTAAQFRSSFSIIKPDALIVEQESKSACLEVARQMGIPILRLISHREDPAGIFALEGAAGKTPVQRGLAEPGDIALLMHTSGSTSRPKLAPLTHMNVCSGSANNVVQLGLTSADRCLCVTGMYFTQGILVSVFSSLIAGGSAACTPGYDPVGFFEWLDEFDPTWYAAPAAIQKSILARSVLYPEKIARARLRVIRCSSAPASADFISRMEELFHAPMLDSYGMTETSSTIVGEPLPPGRRKSGSVGVAIGCDIKIVDERGLPRPAGDVGEVVVRGPNVIRAYEGDSEANKRSFFGEWLRTGDLGRLDEDGYLFLSGRIKEIINRGGEKISPVEIDEALNSHPAVAEALAFSLPDARLGEEIGAAVTLRDPSMASADLESALRNHVAARLPASRIPRRFIFLEQIPKGPTGKALRIGLAEKLGLKPVLAPPERPAENTGRKMASSPNSIVEMLLLHMMEDLLGRKPIGPHDDFFDLGADSLLCARLVSWIEDTFHRKISPANLLEASTASRLAALLSSSPAGGFDFEASQVIGIRPRGTLPPLVLLDPHPLFRSLILSLPEQVPVFGLAFPNPARLSTAFQLEEIAALQIDALRRYGPKGPWALAGWCADGVLAYEMGRQLRAQGEEVPLVAMFDAFNPQRARDENVWNARRYRFQYHLANLAKRDLNAALDYGRERVQTLARKIRQRLWRARYRMHLATERRTGDPLRKPDQILTLAASRYEPGPYDGRVVLCRAADRPKGKRADAAYGWGLLAADLDVVDVPGNHREMFLPPRVGIIGSALVGNLSRASLLGPELVRKSANPIR